MKYFSAKVAEVKTALKNNTFMMFLEICYLTAIKFSGVRPVVRVTRLFVSNQRKKTKNILHVCRGAWQRTKSRAFNNSVRPDFQN